MANEITLTSKLRFIKGGTDVKLEVNGLSVSVTGTIVAHLRQTIGTSAEALNMGDATVGGYILMVNRDATNYVSVRPSAIAADLVRMKAGECCLFRLDETAGSAPYLIANTAACEVEFVAVSK